MGNTIYKYDEIKVQDLSNIEARRIDAVILLKEEYDKEQIKDLIKKLTKKYTKYNYTSFENVNPNTTKSDVVWLHIADNEKNLEEFKYIARTMWITKKLDNRYKPVSINGNDNVDDIEIRWRNEIS
jgi:hypothetical protein